MRISDWSSDVCSSDLMPVAKIVARHRYSKGVLGYSPTADHGGKGRLALGAFENEWLDDPCGQNPEDQPAQCPDHDGCRAAVWRTRGRPGTGAGFTIGRASCREKGCQYV